MSLYHISNLTLRDVCFVPEIVDFLAKQISFEKTERKSQYLQKALALKILLFLFRCCVLCPLVGCRIFFASFTASENKVPVSKHLKIWPLKKAKDITSTDL